MLYFGFVSRVLPRRVSTTVRLGGVFRKQLGPIGNRSIRGYKGAPLREVEGAMSDESRVVVITGASAGIGRATAHAFAREGARIGLAARSVKALEETAHEVEKLGGQALVIPADVSVAENLENAAESLESHFGPIDVWVNNAMASVFSPVIEMTPEDYRRVTEVTYLGYVYGALAALKRMRRRNKGHLIFVGSALAYRGIPLQSAYCAAKHAVQGFFDSLRCELIHEKSNIRLTMVQMPAVNTPQFRWVKKPLSPESSAGSSHLCASSRSGGRVVGQPP